MIIITQRKKIRKEEIKTNNQLTWSLKRNTISAPSPSSEVAHFWQPCLFPNFTPCSWCKYRPRPKVSTRRELHDVALRWRSPICLGPLAATCHTHTVLSARMHTFSPFFISARSSPAYETMRWWHYYPADRNSSWRCVGAAGAISHTHTPLSLPRRWIFTPLLLHPCVHEPSSAPCLPPSRCKHHTV